MESQGRELRLKALMKEADDNCCVWRYNYRLISTFAVFISG